MIAGSCGDRTHADVRLLDLESSSLDHSDNDPAKIRKNDVQHCHSMTMFIKNVVLKQF